MPWLAQVVLLAVGVRMLWVLYVNVDPNDGRFDDSIFYHNVGRSLAMGWGYMDPWGRGPTAQWPPAYPAALAVVFKVFWWDLLWAKGLNVLFSAATVVLVYALGRRLFNRWVAYVGALLLALFPGQIYFATLVLTETMFAMAFLLVVLAVLLWTVERSDIRWWQVSIIGFLVGTACMVRAEGILLVPIILVLWTFVVRPWSVLLKCVPLLLTGLVLALLPWTIRNALEFDQFIPLRPNPRGIAAAGLSPDFERYGGIDDPPLPTLGETLSYWSDRPWELPGFAWHKMQLLYKNDDDGILWVQSGQAILGQGTADRWSSLANVYFRTAGALALLAVPLCLRPGRKDRQAVVVFGVGWSLMFLVFVPQTRYHFPVGPLVSLLAAAFVCESASVAWRSLRGAARRSRVGLASSGAGSDGAG